MQLWHQRSVTWPRCSRTATRIPPTNSSSRCRTKELLANISPSPHSVTPTLCSSQLLCLSPHTHSVSVHEEVKGVRIFVCESKEMITLCQGVGLKKSDMEQSLLKSLDCTELTFPSNLVRQWYPVTPAHSSQPLEFSVFVLKTPAGCLWRHGSATPTAETSNFQLLPHCSSNCPNEGSQSDPLHD